MPFTIIRQDITKLAVDAIVNAANTALAMGGGVCGAIFEAAGAEQMQAACDRLAPIAVGEAVLTDGFLLPCRYVIHAAGPVYREWTAEKSAQLLREAYTSALRVAVCNHCESIAFPLISSGIYGYPKEAALRVASSAILDFLADNELDVSLVVFDDAAFAASAKLVSHVQDYLDVTFTKPPKRKRALGITRRKLLDVEQEAFACADAACPNEVSFTAHSSEAAAPTKADTGTDALDARIQHLDEPFSTTLLRLIDEKGQTDVAVYKRANLDRKLFSKIRTGKGYMPSKRTVLALAIALELTLPETDDLLERAGFALSHSQKFDVIVEYFILNRGYDLFAINEVLFQYDQPLLGG